MSWPKQPTVPPPIHFHMEEGSTTVAKLGPAPRWRKGDKLDCLEAVYPSKRLLTDLGYELLPNDLELLSLLSSDQGERSLLRQFLIKRYAYREKVGEGFNWPQKVQYLPTGWGDAATVQEWETVVDDRPVPSISYSLFAHAIPMGWWRTPKSETGPSIKGRPEEFVRVIGLTVGFSATGKIIPPWSS